MWAEWMQGYDLTMSKEDIEKYEAMKKRKKERTKMTKLELDNLKSLMNETIKGYDAVCNNKAESGLIFGTKGIGSKMYCLKRISLLRDKLIEMKKEIEKM